MASKQLRPKTQYHNPMATTVSVVKLYATETKSQLQGSAGDALKGLKVLRAEHPIVGAIVTPLAVTWAGFLYALATFVKV